MKTKVLNVSLMIESWQWVTFCDPWTKRPIIQLARDLWPVTQTMTSSRSRLFTNL